VSISSTFYFCLFLYKSGFRNVYLIRFRLCIFWQKIIDTKPTHKMLIKLTAGQPSSKSIILYVYLVKPWLSKLFWRTLRTSVLTFYCRTKFARVSFPLFFTLKMQILIRFIKHKSIGKRGIHIHINRCKDKVSYYLGCHGYFQQH